MASPRSRVASLTMFLLRALVALSGGMFVVGIWAEFLSYSQLADWSLGGSITLFALAVALGGSREVSMRHRSNRGESATSDIYHDFSPTTQMRHGH